MGMNAMKPASSSHDVALRDALAALGAELMALGRGADDLQRLIGPLVRQAGVKADDSVVSDVQNLDRLVQRLFLLAARLHAVSAAAPEDWRIEDVFAAPAGAAPARGGELELF
jgi:hypothetical protein